MFAGLAGLEKSGLSIVDFGQDENADLLREINQSLSITPTALDGL